MRNFVVSVAFLVSMHSFGLMAEECKTKFVKGDGVDSLNASLSCFSREISRLHDEVNAIRSSKVGNNSGSEPTTLPLLQDNATFSMFSAAFSQKNQDLNFLFRIKNKTNQEIRLAFENGSVEISDEYGISTQSYNTSLQRLNKGDAHQQAYTIIGPAANKNVSVTTNDAKIKGSNISLSANVMLLNDDKISYYSIYWQAVPDRK